MPLFVGAQKTAKTYYDIFGTKVKEIFSTNSNGVKNGPYKHFFENGSVYEEGQYAIGPNGSDKNGSWKTYDLKGRLSSIETFKNGKYDGVVKQWSTSVYNMDKKYYLISESIYNMGLEEKNTQYHSNGQKSKYTCVNGICNEWFENGNKESEWVNTNGVAGEMTYYLIDGRQVKELKNGKIYKYSTRGFEYIGDQRSSSYGALLSVEFDSSGFHYLNTYNESTKNNYLMAVKKTNLSDNTAITINYNEKGEALNETGQTQEEQKIELENKLRLEKKKKYAARFLKSEEDSISNFLSLFWANYEVQIIWKNYEEILKPYGGYQPLDENLYKEQIELPECHPKRRNSNDKRCSFSIGENSKGQVRDFIYKAYIGDYTYFSDATMNLGKLVERYHNDLENNGFELSQDRLDSNAFLKNIQNSQRDYYNAVASYRKFILTKNHKKIKSETLKYNDDEIHRLNEKDNNNKILKKYEMVHKELMQRSKTENLFSTIKTYDQLISFQEKVKRIFINKDKESEKIIKDSETTLDILRNLKIPTD